MQKNCTLLLLHLLLMTATWCTPLHVHRSCVQKGYFKDDYIKYFVRRSSRRSPLINRGELPHPPQRHPCPPSLHAAAEGKMRQGTGYFSRVLVLRQLLQQFLEAARQQAERRVQVLSLGAGFDTTFFHCQVRSCSLPGLQMPVETGTPAAEVPQHQTLSLCCWWAGAGPAGKRALVRGRLQGGHAQEGSRHRRA